MSMLTLCVFWVRGDNWINFSKDYTRILRVISSVETEPKTPSEGFLIETKEMLESKSSEWILFIDNADDLQEFRNNIQKYVPRRGRIVITTRDRRFQGTVGAANHGCHITPMRDKEAIMLLRKFLPTELVDTAAWEDSARSIVKSVGNLPLAIAQAAANSLEHGIPISRFAAILSQQSEITGRLSEPVRDFMSSDERNSMQSVTTTWTMSFDTLKETSSQSIALLGYLACFDSRSLPYLLLRRLPEFQHVDEADFLRYMGKLHQLCLAERVVEDSNMAAQMHPLVHEIAWKSICGNEPQRWLQPTVDLVCLIFPLVNQDKDSNWDLCTYFAPHALRMVQLGQECGLITKQFARLMQCLSCYLNACGEHELANAIVSDALVMAVNVWGPESPSTLYVSKIKIDCLEDSLRNQEALALARDALRYLDSDAARLSLPKFEVLEERFLLTAKMAKITRRDRDYPATMELERLCLNIIEDGKQAWLDQSRTGGGLDEPPNSFKDLSELVAKNDRQGLLIVYEHKFNIANALGRCGKTEESLQQTEELLSQLALDDVKEPEWISFFHAMLNNKANMISERNPWEAFDIFYMVFRQSLSTLGILDDGTWVAANNVIDYAGTHPEEVTRVWEDLLGAALKPGVNLPHSSNLNAILTAMAHTFSLADYRIVEFRCHNKSDEADELARKLAVVRRDFARGIDFRAFEAHNADAMINSRGVSFQKLGKFKEAEAYHREAIARARDKGTTASCYIYSYNIMLAMARQGRMEDALSYRSQHLDEVSRAEAIYGVLEARMDQDEKSKSLYDEAVLRIRQGESRGTGSWWEENDEAVSRAEVRYGKIRHLDQPQAEDAEVEAAPDKSTERVRVGHQLKRLGKTLLFNR
jgi:tetratricopeptide (TPR) repeat protein